MNKIYKCERAKALFNMGEFEHYVSNGDWGFMPSHKFYFKKKYRSKTKERK